MKPIYTSSWSTALPPTFRKIGIRRSVPRGLAPGYKRIKSLEFVGGLRRGKSIDEMKAAVRYLAANAHQRHQPELDLVPVGK